MTEGFQYLPKFKGAVADNFEPFDFTVKEWPTIRISPPTVDYKENSVVQKLNAAYHFHSKTQVRNLPLLNDTKKFGPFSVIHISGTQFGNRLRKETFPPPYGLRLFVLGNATAHGV